MKFLKTALTIALLYPVVWFAIFIWPDMKEDLFQDKCSMEYVTRKYESVKNKPAMSEMDKHVQKVIKQNNLFHVPEEEIKKTFIINSLLIGNKCDVPNELSKKFNTYIYGSSGGDRVCAEGMFLEQAKIEYDKIAANKDTYQVYEKQFYTEAIREMSKERTRKVFDLKWEDPGFRKKAMLGAFQSLIREEEKCENPFAPMTNIMAEMVQESLPVIIQRP